MKVLCAQLQHETNTFNRRPTTLDHFAKSGILRDDEIAKTFRGTHTDWGCLFEKAGDFGWSLITTIHANAVPSGVVTDETFEQLCAPILEAAESGKPDAAFLMLHGSMVAASFDDCEGELLNRLRALLPEGAPIVVTLDPHGNVSQAMAAAASALTAYRTTPHVDQYETTQRACELLKEISEKRLRTRIVLAQPPTIDGLDRGRTISGFGPMVDILRMASAAMEHEAGILTISIQAGFVFSDIENAGPSVAVTGLAGASGLELVAQRLSSFIWATRATKTIAMLSIDETIAALRADQNGRAPLLIGDYTDNPGGGAAGDGTALLKAMIDADIRNVAFFSIADPIAVQICWQAGAGAKVELQLGGRANPDLGGGPIGIHCTVKALSDGRYVRKGPYFNGVEANLGPSALVDVNGIKVIVCTYANQTEEREQFRIFGIEPEAFDYLACKAMNHFRADLGPISRGLIYVDSGGICTPHLSRLPYQRVRRPVWPLVEAASVSGSGELGHVARHTATKTTSPLDLPGSVAELALSIRRRMPYSVSPLHIPASSKSDIKR
ncbi:M81 family metallopeptidase [Aminobacter sp. BA135]|uniref:M81 family metallopeptidase n=1 Tax=Aminobacter sp. BA135 TaxID=537596 RepID=UPI003D78DB20